MPADLDFIIMGCDGVWEQKTNEEMVSWIYKKIAAQNQATAYSANLNSIIESLLKTECLSPNHVQSGGLGCDNMTAILIAFGK